MSKCLLIDSFLELFDRLGTLVDSVLNPTLVIGGNTMKTDVIAILSAAKDQQVAKVSELFDGMISQVNALPEDPNLTDLQKQVSDLTAANTDLTTQVTNAQAVIAADASTLTDEKSKEAKLQAKLDAIKAALDNN